MNTRAVERGVTTLPATQMNDAAIGAMQCNLSVGGAVSSAVASAYGRAYDHAKHATTVDGVEPELDSDEHEESEDDEDDDDDDEVLSDTEGLSDHHLMEGSLCGFQPRGYFAENDVDAAGGGASAASPSLAGRSTPAHGFDNPLLDVLLSPREGGARKRRREDVETPVLRLPTVARFSDTDAAVQPWTVSARVPRPRKGYMQHQPNISHPLRVALIDWLVDVVEVYRFRIHTLYAAINFLDRFLSKIAIERKVLQLTGVTCLMLAAKYEEINPPSVEEFAYITDSTYSRDAILKMECAILDVLKFELRVDSPLNYTEHLLVAADACDSARELCAYLIMLTTVDAEVYLGADPEIIAAAAVVLALNSLHESALPPGLAVALAHSAIHLTEVSMMSALLHRTHRCKNVLSTSLHRKFSTMDHHMVARLRPAVSPPTVSPLRGCSYDLRSRGAPASTEFPVLEMEEAEFSEEVAA
eukprot:m.192671 g.192671  ORF g.192671 m.192671 type:complete len:472 (+) comp24954_c0_seq1:267-1682(+)